MLNTILSSEEPSIELEKLRQSGWLKENIPEVHALFGIPQDPKHHPEVDTGIHIGMVLDQAAKAKSTPDIVYAALVHDLGKALTPAEELPRHRGHENTSVPLVEAVSDRLGIDLETKKLAVLVAREHGNIHGSLNLNPDAVLRLFKRCDALENPDAFKKMLKACEFDARGRLGLENSDYPQSAKMEKALDRVLQVNIPALREEFKDLPFEKIAKRIDTALSNAIEGKPPMQSTPQNKENLEKLANQKINNLMTKLNDYLSNNSDYVGYSVSRDQAANALKMQTPGKLESIIATKGGNSLQIDIEKSYIAKMASSPASGTGAPPPPVSAHERIRDR